MRMELREKKTEQICLTQFRHKRYSIKGRKEMFYFTTHTTHFIYGYMASDIW